LTLFYNTRLSVGICEEVHLPSGQGSILKKDQCSYKQLNMILSNMHGQYRCYRINLYSSKDAWVTFKYNNRSDSNTLTYISLYFYS